MKVIACYKIIPLDDEISIRSDRSVCTDKAELIVSPYDFNAIEAAVKIKESVDGVCVSVLTAGPGADDSKTRKAVLSRGADEMFGVNTGDIQMLDSYASAVMLKAAIEKIGGADLVICGEGSGDMYNQQVGNILGQLMGCAVINGVCGIAAFEDHLVVERKLESGAEEMEIKLPAVISVTSDVNLPRIANFKEIMAAGKKPFTVWSAKELGVSDCSGFEVVSILAPEQTERKNMIFSGEDEETVLKLFNEIRRLV